MTSLASDGLLPTVRRLRAIILREVGSRYAGDKLGYLWAYIFPLSWLLVIYVAFVLLNRQSPIDTDIVSFLLSGVMPYLAARFVINAIIRARAAYRHLIILPQVSLVQIVSAIFLLELGNGLLMFAGLLAANYVIFGYLELHDPVIVLFAFFLALASGGSFAFLLTALSRISPIIPKSAPIILRPLFYVSGVFYIANEIPPGLLRLMAWNPLFHAIELLREGMFSGYSSVLAEVWVPIVFILTCTLLGIFLISLGRLPFEAQGGEELV